MSFEDKNEKAHPLTKQSSWSNISNIICLNTRTRQLNKVINRIKRVTFIDS